MLQLETNRLLFRRYVTTDLPFITELVRNSLVMQYIDDGHVNQALKQYAVDEWEIERFVSMIMVGNEGSVRIAEKNGLTLEKVFLQHEKEVQLFSYCKK